MMSRKSVVMMIVLVFVILSCRSGRAVHHREKVRGGWGGYDRNASTRSGRPRRERPTTRQQIGKLKTEIKELERLNSKYVDRIWRSNIIFETVGIRAEVRVADFLELPVRPGSIFFFDVNDKIKVQQVIDDKNFIGQIMKKGNDKSTETVWFRGFDTRTFVDDKVIRAPTRHIFIANSKTTYLTVMGASKTVLVVRKCTRLDLLPGLNTEHRI